MGNLEITPQGPDGESSDRKAAPARPSSSEPTLFGSALVSPDAARFISPGLDARVVISEARRIIDNIDLTKRTQSMQLMRIEKAHPGYLTAAVLWAMDSEPTSPAHCKQIVESLMQPASVEYSKAFADAIGAALTLDKFGHAEIESTCKKILLQSTFPPEERARALGTFLRGSRDYRCSESAAIIGLQNSAVAEPLLTFVARYWSELPDHAREGLLLGVRLHPPTVGAADVLAQAALVSPERQALELLGMFDLVPGSYRSALSSIKRHTSEVVRNSASALLGEPVDDVTESVMAIRQALLRTGPVAKDVLKNELATVTASASVDLLERITLAPVNRRPTVYSDIALLAPAFCAVGLKGFPILAFLGTSGSDSGLRLDGVAKIAKLLPRAETIEKLLPYSRSANAREAAWAVHTLGALIPDSKSELIRILEKEERPAVRDAACRRSIVLESGRSKAAIKAAVEIGIAAMRSPDRETSKQGQDLIEGFGRAAGVALRALYDFYRSSPPEITVRLNRTIPLVSPGYRPWFLAYRVLSLLSSTPPQE